MRPEKTARTVDSVGALNCASKWIAHDESKWSCTPMHSLHQVASRRSFQTCTGRAAVSPASPRIGGPLRGNRVTPSAACRSASLCRSEGFTSRHRRATRRRAPQHGTGAAIAVPPAPMRQALPPATPGTRSSTGRPSRPTLQSRSQRSSATCHGISLSRHRSFNSENRRRASSTFSRCR